MKPTKTIQKGRILQDFSLIALFCGFLYLAFAVQHEVDVAVENNNIMWQNKMEHCICWNDTDGNQNINQDTKGISEIYGKEIAAYTVSLSPE